MTNEFLLEKVTFCLFICQFFSKTFGYKVMMVQRFLFGWPPNPGFLGWQLQWCQFAL
jgi:hypothetical protein